jgi:hypothetical protein
MQKGPEKRLFSGTDATAEQHQKVDVGVQAQMPATVSAEREHDDVRIQSPRFGKEPTEHRVDAIGVTLERGSSSGPSEHLGLELRPRRIEGRDERRRARTGLGQ